MTPGKEEEEDFEAVEVTQEGRRVSKGGWIVRNVGKKRKEEGRNTMNGNGKKRWKNEFKLFCYGSLEPFHDFKSSVLVKYGH